MRKPRRSRAPLVASWLFAALLCGTSTARALTRGEVLTITLRPQLPLTPPPGVQQKAALSGWSARLSRQAESSMSEDRWFGYDLRLLRIRPTSGPEYAFDWLTPPWMAPGVYDMEVRGPGFVRREPGAVQVTSSPEAATRPLSELLVPAQVEAVALSRDGQPVAISEVTWAGVPDAKQRGPRLVRFAAAPSPVEVEGVKAAPCALRLEWRTAQDVPLDSYDEIRAKDQGAVSIAFDLARARWSVGPVARPLWLVSETPLVEAWSLDRHAAQCTTAKEGQFHRPLVRDACSAAAIGTTRQERSCWLKVFLVALPGSGI